MTNRAPVITRATACDRFADPTPKTAATATSNIAKRDKRPEFQIFHTEQSHFVPLSRRDFPRPTTSKTKIGVQHLVSSRKIDPNHASKLSESNSQNHPKSTPKMG